ncbi:MAG TPA: metal-dependent transcriptional regulator [Armatimonadota bacterium]|jgi:DtxR family Mn-dependent transcriptional regulator
MAAITANGLTAQGEEYLEAICRISERGEAVTPTELARELGVAPPSVLGMLKRLEEQGLLSYARQTGAHLSESGSFAAERLRRRHRLAERMLTDLLGMPWERAHDVACRFEHVIDDEVEGYLRAALHGPTTCPHGNPLDGHAATATTGWRSLVALAPGETGILRCVVDESAAMLEYLIALQLLPGVRVTVCAHAPFDGPLTVEVDGKRHAVSRQMAAHLLVEVEETR